MRDLELTRSGRKRAELAARPHYIYFVQYGDDGPIKIGYAADVKSRVNTIQADCPERVYLRAVMAGAREKELLVHTRFAHLRIRGEWFAPHPELVAFIAERLAAAD